MYFCHLLTNHRTVLTWCALELFCNWLKDGKVFEDPELVNAEGQLFQNDFSKKSTQKIDEFLP